MVFTGFGDHGTLGSAEQSAEEASLDVFLKGSEKRSNAGKKSSGPRNEDEELSTLVAKLALNTARRGMEMEGVVLKPYENDREGNDVFTATDTAGKSYSVAVPGKGEILHMARHTSTNSMRSSRCSQR